MTILITGIHGFVGSNLVKALKTNHTIYGLDITTQNKEGVEMTFLWNEFHEIPNVDVVIHLAGKAHDTKNQTNAQVYFDINTGLTEKIYDWFLKSSATKFIFFSSVKAAADKVIGDILTEDITPTPVGPYGESKIAAENFLLSQEPRAKSQDKKTYILRPCMIHGPGNKGNLNLLYNVVKKGIPYPLGAFENRRSFTSIDNLSFVIDQLIEKNIESGIYNVADDETLSTNELISLIAQTTNKPNRIWNWNAGFIRLIAKVGTKLHLPLNEERLQKLTENYVVSNLKLKKALKLDRMPVQAKDGFRKTIKSFE
ncbi:MAG: NAD-dependent epimerase/dehydratase family protein [Paludibacter sp.]|nr:NAD-dependent epimerase/dehydratase family protein [Paludibacter sp.]